MYLRPRSLEEAVAALTNNKASILSGGTDFFPSRVGKPLPPDIVDISGIERLRGIDLMRTHVRIGATTRWTDFLRADLPPAFDALKQAAREVGSVQIQNRATMAGNLCNASPAADGIPPLLALDAEVELASQKGKRRLKLSEFLIGYRSTALAPGEILTNILIPMPDPQDRSAFLKLGARRYLVISIVMVAALLRMKPDGAVAKARVAVGSASAVAQRLVKLERDLAKLKPGRAPSSILAPSHLEPLSPIDDVRATAAYRRDAAMHLIAAALDRAAGAAVNA